MGAALAGYIRHAPGGGCCGGHGLYYSDYSEGQQQAIENDLEHAARLLGELIGYTHVGSAMVDTM